MRLVGHILLACLLLAVIQAVLAVLAVAFLLLVVWGLLFRTRETVGLIAFCLFLEALFVHPFVTVCITCVLGALVWIARTKETDGPSDQSPIALLPPPTGREDGVPPIK